MAKQLNFISEEFIETYFAKCQTEWLKVVINLRAKAGFTPEEFENYLLSSSLYSCMMDGNSLDMKTFLKSRAKKNSQHEDEINEIEDLAKAYKFATENKLTKTHFFKAYEISSTHLFPKEEKGKIRTTNVKVKYTKSSTIIYLPVEPNYINIELNKLFIDISVLLKRTMSYKEIFYHASIIHLWVLKIHPFTDGNAKMARLAEKWFLVAKLGLNACAINSEKYYLENKSNYYKNIVLGDHYDALHWKRCMPFIFMLSSGLKELL